MTPRRAALLSGPVPGADGIPHTQHHSGLSGFSRIRWFMVGFTALIADVISKIESTLYSDQNFFYENTHILIIILHSFKARKKDCAFSMTLSTHLLFSGGERRMLKCSLCLCRELHMDWCCKGLWQRRALFCLALPAFSCLLQTLHQTS
ncbi:hypothetical protein MG293_017059 [Ovis ammon polii]|uniref:Uncharacterized protein n=1 Tax=Ovis ammon polii TaxID=230172 RepID=A0AAD4TU15_OVIAM|nr:hypothetical protein MG293_017059 [Ovis ammon polii]